MGLEDGEAPVSDLEKELEVLFDAPAGRLLRLAGHRLRRRLGFLMIMFGLLLAIGMRFSTTVLSWLIEGSGLVPNDVELVVLSPIEVILIRLRIAVGLATFVCVLFIALDIALVARRTPEVRAWADEIDLDLHPPPAIVLFWISFGIVLAIAGLVYAIKVLIPFVLSYLHADALAADVLPTWRLADFIGFVVSLGIGSMTAFEVPLVTLLMLQGGALDPKEVQANRRHVWFIAAVAGAMLSPPDPVSMLLVSAPMIILFEVAIFADKLVRMVQDER